MIILHHDLFFFWLCVFLCTFLCISFMESSGQKRARISSVVEASSSASATPGDDDPRKNKVGRRDADGKEELRSEPSTSHTPPNPFPEAPSIDFLRKRIKRFLSPVEIGTRRIAYYALLTRIFTLKRRARRNGSKSPRSSKICPSEAKIFGVTKGSSPIPT